MQKNAEAEYQELRLNENMKNIKHKIVVMSGKGGVGKSTVATNIAYGLALEGKKVGILDADFHGPNIPLMLGIEGEKLADVSKPYQVNENISVVSISFYISKSDAPVIWRGPAKIGAMRQLLADIAWGELDYLVVDLPPGTGDEALTVAQTITGIDGAVIVSTPQDVALLDSRKSINFASMVKMPVLGIIENMSGFECPHCGERIDIFKKGGAIKVAKEYNIDVLGRIPMDPMIVEAGDEGKPFIYFNNKGIAAEEFRSVVSNILQKTEPDNTEVTKTESKIEKEEVNVMKKVALPTNDRETVENHFGHCKEFVIYNIVDGKIGEFEFVAAPAHEVGLLPKFLGDLGINTIITGGMGQKAVDLFKERNVDVILGAVGKITDSLNEYLGGNLYSRGSACQHD